MKTYVSFHPAHPETYAFRVARCLDTFGCTSAISSKLDGTRFAQSFALLFIITLITACGSSRKSVDVELKNQVQEHEERLSVGQSIFALFDSLSASHLLEADSLVIERPTPYPSRDGGEGWRVDTLLQAGGHPSITGGAGGGSTVVKIYGIRSNTQLTHTQTAGAENVSVDTASRHRNIHEEVTESYVTEKEVKPPNTFLKLAVLVMAIAILLGVALFAVGKFRR